MLLAVCVADNVFSLLVPSSSRTNMHHWTMVILSIILQEKWMELAFLLAGETALDLPGKKRKFTDDPMGLVRIYPELHLNGEMPVDDFGTPGSVAPLMASKYSSRTVLHQLQRIGVDWNSGFGDKYPLRVVWNTQPLRENIVFLLLEWGANPATMFGFNPLLDATPLHAATIFALNLGPKGKKPFLL